MGCFIHSLTHVTLYQLIQATPAQSKCRLSQNRMWRLLAGMYAVPYDTCPVV
jgi:hypothetical protein